MGFLEITETLKMSDSEILEYIKFNFNMYQERKKDGVLYSDNDKFPRWLIELYYSRFERTEMTNIFDAYKENYLLLNSKSVKNENEVENVHSEPERLGLSVVYDAIQNNDINVQSLGIYSLAVLHQLLYSLAPHPEFGGQFRTDPAHLHNSPVELCAPGDIAIEISKLYMPVKDLINKGLAVSNNNDYSDIIEYIDNCVKLHCELIQIHPFPDGNGRTTRALMNALFKIANIPPVYVKPSEKIEYFKAMEKAIVEKKYEDIYTFFQYKVCDSIIKLDLSLSRRRNNTK